MGTDAVRTWEGEGEVGRREGAEKEVGGSCGWRQEGGAGRVSVDQ